MFPESFIIGNTKIKLGAIASTNDFTRELLTKGDKITEGTVVIAENQYNGKGQRGNNWVSEPGMGLTFSVVLFPKFLSPSDQFELSQAISLGIVSYLREVLPVNMSAICVKWPNDIYVEEKKICGILIENSVSGSRLTHSIVGIGLNINQKIFNDSLPNPTSMRLCSGSWFKGTQVLNGLCGYLDARYIELRNGASQKIKEDYLQSMYGYGMIREYQINGVLHRARAKGVDTSGRLILAIEGAEDVYCDFKEVVFL